MSNLSEIGGSFTLNTYSVTDDLIEFPAVRKIGGNLNYMSNGNIDVNTTLSFPLLESIQGSLNMETGFFWIGLLGDFTISIACMIFLSLN